MKEEIKNTEKCADVINNVVGEKDGIIKTHFDPIGKEVSFAYDPKVISERDVEELANSIAPDIAPRFETCTVKLPGRACEACARSIERKVSGIDGVRKATASYIGGVMSVRFDGAVITSDQLLSKVKNIVRIERGKDTNAQTDEGEQKEKQVWLTEEKLELVFTFLTFIAMVLGKITEGSDVTSGIFYLIAYIAGGTFGVKAGLQSLRQFTIDVDLLMVLAALGAAFIGAPFEGAMLLFLFSLSNVLQAYAIGRTRNAIKSLMKLRPETALVRRGNETFTLPVKKLIIGDTVLLKPGEAIPLDGIVNKGESSIDQSSVTGESYPVKKKKCDPVFGGTINGTGYLEVIVTKLEKDSTIARMIRLVEEAQSEQSKTQRFLDKAEQYYAIGVIVFTLAMILVPVFVLGNNFNESFYKAMTLMVVASPCALIISTPASILSAIGNGARKGILFKGGVYLEEAAEIKTVAFDKTGTLTFGKPQVTDVKVIPIENEKISENELLQIAASVELKSEHPLAAAIVNSAEARNIKLLEIKDFNSITGNGVEAVIGNDKIFVGKLKGLKNLSVKAFTEAEEIILNQQNEGKTSVAVVRTNTKGESYIIGVIAISDMLRPIAKDVVAELKKAGIKTVMLTGDNERVAKAVAQQAGIKEYYADLLPEDKVRIVKEKMKEGKIMMVGDGVNDAPALSAATIGAAMGAAGTDVALETADVVLMSDDLTKIPYAISLSRKARQVVIQNLSFAVGVIIVLIISTFVVSLPLPLGVIGHEGSTVLVCLNGLRLLLYKK